MWNWILIKDRVPYAWETGHWDGKKSDLVIFRTKSGDTILGVTYEGFLDGANFLDFYDKDDYEIQEEVIAWAEIPDFV